jgi:hypothetical protein
MTQRTAEQKIRSSEKVKVTVLLSQADVDDLGYLADLDSTTVTEALRRSIRTVALIRRELASGGQFLLKRKGEQQARELLMV